MIGDRTEDARTGQVAQGEWYPDGWTTPFLRVSFQPVPGLAELQLAAYSPPVAAGPVTLDIRFGCRLLGRTTAIAPGELRACRVAVPAALPTHQSFSLSLRTDKVFEPGGADRRRLGLLVTDWRLVRAATAVRGAA